MCDFRISKVVLQPDGKILVSGASEEIAPRLFRLNSDGSVDNSFLSPSYRKGKLRVWAATPDGKIYATASADPAISPLDTAIRLNSDGTLDNLLLASDKRHAASVLSTDNSFAGRKGYGRRLAFSRVSVQINSDGSKELTFQGPILAHGDPNQRKQIYNFICAGRGNAFKGFLLPSTASPVIAFARPECGRRCGPQCVLNAPVVFGFLDVPIVSRCCRMANTLLWRYLTGQKFVRLTAEGIWNENDNHQPI